MRKLIEDVKFRHERDHVSFDVDAIRSQLDLADYDDVSFQQWLFVHDDRHILLQEIDRLYDLLRRRRRAS